MDKIKSLNDLRKMKQQLEQQLQLREKSNDPDALVQIKVAMATCGIAAGARTVMNTLLERAAAEKLPVIITQTGCMGYCHSEPTVEVRKPGEEPIVFGHVDAKKAIAIIEKYIKRGELLDGIIPQNYESI
ncbi:MAG: (2Fe-2S) ferredoxin domain-containing protein [Prevotellaceae bacterium]|jgi:NADP-reducing hydrogenase subunit HndB|nr:(2Fe-2S) ferredoxin domain-containing protein [Prevotellaceae bacterium]